MSATGSARLARLRTLGPVFVVLALLWSIAATGLVSSNDGSHVALARALALRAEVSIDPDADLTLQVDRAIRDGRNYSDRPPGTAFLAMPAVWLGDRLDPVLTRMSLDRGSLVWTPAGGNYITTHTKRTTRSRPLGALQGTALMLTAHTVLVGLAGLGCVATTLRRRGSNDAAIAWIVGAVGLGSLWGPYSTMLFSHVTTATCMAALLCALEVDRDGSSMGPWVPLLAGLCGGWAVASDYLTLLLVVPLVAVAAPVRRWPWILAGAVPIAIATAAYHHAAFGSVFSIGYDSQSNFAFARDRGASFDGNPLMGSWILFGAGRGAGMLAQSPLSLMGLIALAGSPGRRWLLAAIPFALAVAAHHTPWGGGTLDHRYVIPLLPLAALGLGEVWHRASRSTVAPVRWVVPIVGAFSAVLVWSHFLRWRG